MQGEAHARLFGNRENRLDEIGVVGPDVVGRILAVESRFLDFLPEVVDAKLANLVASLGLDHARGIRVRGVKGDFGGENTGAPQVVEERLESFDVLGPAGPVGFSSSDRRPAWRS